MNPAFETYYSERFAQRWPTLRTALATHHLPILRFAPHHTERARTLCAAHNLTFAPLPWYAHAIAWPVELPFGETMPGVAEGVFYIMNASSLIPPLVLAHTLHDTPSPHILDACAAPGGKTLVLAEELPTAQITANELSAERLSRLRNALALYRHPEITTLKAQAETLFKKTPEHYDAILLDAPCSSEAHVIASEKHMKEWTPNRVKQMQFRQLALLGGLLLALKPGGILVYSTCSLAPEENELVVEKFHHKRSEQIELLNAHDYINAPCGTGLPVVDSTLASRVIRIFPDTHQLDPMFVAVFRKR